MRKLISPSSTPLAERSGEISSVRPVSRLGFSVDSVIPTNGSSPTYGIGCFAAEWKTSPVAVEGDPAHFRPAKPRPSQSPELVKTTAHFWIDDGGNLASETLPIHEPDLMAAIADRWNEVDAARRAAATAAGSRGDAGGGRGRHGAAGSPADEQDGNSNDSSMDRFAIHRLADDGCPNCFE